MLQTGMRAPMGLKLRAPDLETLDRMARIDLNAFPDDPDHEGDVVVGSTLKNQLSGERLRDANRLVLSRGPDGLWRFNQDTVAEIEAYYTLIEIPAE